MLAMAPRIVWKARREGVAIGVATLALVAAYSHQAGTVTPGAAPLDWAGDLSPLSPSEAAVPLSSASLVVPKEQLALPPLPAKAQVVARSSCDSADKLCVVRAPRSSQPRQVAASEVSAAKASQPVTAGSASSHGRPPATRTGFLDGINPLSRLKTLGRPFAAAGSSVSDWLGRL